MKTQSKTRILLIRIATAIKIILYPSKHWFLIEIKQDDLKQQLQQKNFKVSIICHKLTQYNAKQIIVDLSESIDDLDLALEKAAFEGEAEYEYGNKKHN